MADDLEMPAFDKPENIPLVVPDRPARFCIATTKAGKPCGFVKALGTDYCVPHNPAITQEQRNEWRKKRLKPKEFYSEKAKRAHGHRHTKSRADILEILSMRFDKFLAQFGDVVNIEVEQIICDMARTYVTILKAEVASDDQASKGWRMKGTA